METRVRPGEKRYCCTVILLFAFGVISTLGAVHKPLHAQRTDYAVPVETNDGWRTASLSAKGMDTEPFLRLLKWLHDADDHKIHSILVVKDGALVFEVYCDGSDFNLFDENLLTECTLCLEDIAFTRDELHFAASVTKSVTSILVGIAVDRGHVSDTDAPMFSFFPDYAHLRSPSKDSITVHHMLSMTTGLPFDESTYPITDSRNDAFQLFVAEDPVEFALADEVVHPPGTTFLYNSATTVLLGEIIRRTTGQSVASFAEDHLFAPLGITSYRWAGSMRAPEVTFASGGLYLRPRDMAKIGQLMLQEGVWNGRRVVSSDWVQRSVSMAIPLFNRSGAYAYGYQWRLGRIGGFTAFYAAGWGGQYIVVLPELDIVFVQTGGWYEHNPIRYDTIIEQYVLPAVRR